jgi:hypothetical protein
MPSDSKNRLNRWTLREHVFEESVDLVYLEQPFNSNANDPDR